MTAINPAYRDPWTKAGASTSLSESFDPNNRYIADLLAQYPQLAGILDQATRGASSGGDASGPMPDTSALNGYTIRASGDSGTLGGKYSMGLFDPKGTQVANKDYTASDKGGYDKLTQMYPMLMAAGFGGLGLFGPGGALSGAAGSGSSAGLLSGMDLAADAGIMGANGIGGAAASFGAGGIVPGIEGLLPEITAPTTLTGSAAPLATGSLIPEASFISASSIPALAGGAGLLSSAAGSAGKFLTDNAGLMKLIGPVLGGLIGKSVGDNNSSGGGGGGGSINMTPQAPTQQAPTLRPWEPSKGLPSGLGSTSAGLFDEYMKQQLGGGLRTYYAPTFGKG